jgi:hypothetical protein
MLMHISDNPRWNALGNWFLGIFVLIALVAGIWASGINSDRAAQAVKTEDAGTVVSAALASGSSGAMYRGMGVVTADYYTSVETTKGSFVLPGKLSFMKSTPLRMETTRDGKKRICKDETCYPVVL